jgi:DNA-binding beta-propeller fold protein YncE
VPGVHQVTPINTATGKKGSPITVGHGPIGLAVTPDGRTLYVLNTDDSTLTPITTATGTPGRSIRVATLFAQADAAALVFTPNGHKLYVANEGTNAVAVISPKE